jgi:hypothetical protein
LRPHHDHLVWDLQIDVRPAAILSSSINAIDPVELTHDEIVCGADPTHLPTAIEYHPFNFSLNPAGRK